MQVYKKILVAMDCSSVDDAIIEHVEEIINEQALGVFTL